MTSISDFRGSITGNGLSVVIKEGQVVNGPTVVLRLFDESGAVKECIIERVQSLREFDFGGVVRCHYLGHEREQLAMEYVPEVEEAAQILGAVILHILIAAQPSIGD